MVFTRTVNHDYGSDYSVYDVVRSVCLLVCIPRDLPRRKRGNNRLLARTNFSCRRKFRIVERKLSGSFLAGSYLKYETYGFLQRCSRSSQFRERRNNLDGLENFWNLVQEVNTYRMKIQSVRARV